MVTSQWQTAEASHDCSEVAPPAGKQRTQHTHVLGLDLIRLLAATFVMAYHYCFWEWGRVGRLSVVSPTGFPAWGMTLHFGWVGVEIFFVISGFVIAYSASNAQSSVFLRNRFLRLAPASWIAASLALILLWSSGQTPFGRLFYLYGITMAFWPLNAIGGVWWTLGIEIDFYLLVYFLLRMRRSAALESTMVGVGLASGVFWAFAISLQSSLTYEPGWCATLRYLVMHAEGNRELQLLLVQQGCLFALGVVAWNALAYGVTKWRALCGIGLTCCCILEIVGQNGIISRAAQMDLSVWPAITTWLLAMATLVLAMLFNGAFARFAGERGKALLRSAGLMTYPLYLTHRVVGIAVLTVALPRVGVIASVVIAIICAYSVAAVIAVWAEPALRRRIATLLPRVLVTADVSHPSQEGTASEMETKLAAPLT